MPNETKSETPRTDAEEIEMWRAQCASAQITIQLLETKLTQQEQRANALDSGFQEMIREALLCDPIAACKREDGEIEPPWEAVSRTRQERDELARWKAERLQVDEWWKEVAEMVRNHPSMRPGESVAKAAKRLIFGATGF